MHYAAPKNGVSHLHSNRKTKVIAQTIVALMLSSSCMALLSGNVLATSYTTTQTTNLQDGDTIATTGAGTAGYGLWSKAGTTLLAPGNNTITTTGNNAHGLYAFQLNVPQSNITAIGTTITVGGTGAHATYVSRDSVLTLQNVTATANGANGEALFITQNGIANVTGSTFVSALGTAVEVGGGPGPTLTMDASSVTANGDNARALSIYTGSAATVTGHTMSDISLNSATAGQTLTDGNKGFGYGLSAEAGKRVDIDSYWSLTPQAQRTWSSVKFDTFNDAWGASVSVVI